MNTSSARITMDTNTMTTDPGTNGIGAADSMEASRAA